MSDLKEKIINEINKDIMSNISYHDSDNGGGCPLICITCDTFLDKPKSRFIPVKDLERHSHLLMPQQDLHPDVLAYYTYSGPQTSDILKKCLLSPKGIYQNNEDDHSGSLLICESCRRALQDQKTPPYAIANKFEFGNQPDVLKELTDVELAFISSVRFHSHILTFSGGHKGIKGYHSLIRTNIEKTRQCLEQMKRIEKLPNNIIVVLHGDFTEDQKNITISKCKIRQDKCEKALDWLIENNICFRNIDRDQLLDSLSDPIIVDLSKSVDSENANIESVTEITVVFPDRNLDSSTGGCNSISEFKALLDDLNTNELTASIKLSDIKYINDYDDDNFIKAFPRHFPYGYGGPQEKRLLSNGSTKTLTKESYFKHVTNLSNIVFHEALFTLVAFNIVQRERIFHSVGWFVTNDDKRCKNISNLAPDAVIEEIERRNGGNNKYSSSNSEGASAYLDKISAIAKSMPHTKEAAKQARKDLISMQIAHGQPSIFLTITPPDDDSLLINVYSQLNINELTDLNEITSEMLRERAETRSELRFKYPGLSTLNFERLLTVITKNIIGWKNNNKDGFFGKTKAYFMTVEEQARKTLHVHVLLWLENLPFDLEDLDRNKDISKLCEKEIIKYVDTILSTHLAGDKAKVDCCEYKKDKKHRHYVRTIQPKLKDNQALRNIRHKDGCRKEFGATYICPKCDKQWAPEELAFAMIQKKSGIKLFPDATETNVQPKDKLKYASRAAQEYILDNDIDKDTKKDLVNALSNCHRATHAKTCFPVNKKSSKRKLECRYHLPQLPNKKTKIFTSEEEMEWYNGHGASKKRKIHQVIPKRGNFDVTMNMYCPVVSESLLACNSNVHFIINCCHCFYVTKYASKDTQEEDSSGYKPVAEHVQKRLILKKFDEDTSECMSRLISASIVHSSKNVISATLAKYLIHNKSRFHYSDTIIHIPIAETKSILDKSNFFVRLSEEGKIFLESRSLHYLLRSKDLEDVNLHDFFTKFVVVKQSRLNKKNSLEVYEFLDKHPGKDFQCVIHQKNEVIGGISNFSFVDTSSFNGSILDESLQITASMEDYAKTVLLLFLPFRNKDDLLLENSYTKKLRQVYENFKSKEVLMLDRIQNVRNSSRYLEQFRSVDELRECTEAFKSEETSKKGNDDLEEEDDPDDEVNDLFIKEFFSAKHLEHNEDSGADAMITNDKSIAYNSENLLPESLDLEAILDKGTHRCGYDLVCNGNVFQTETFLEIEGSNNTNTEERPDNDNNENFGAQKVSKRQMYELLISATQRIIEGSQSRNKTRDDMDMDENQDDDIFVNGTVDSIHSWCQQANFDDNQNTAFIVIISHFLLTFFEETDKDISTFESSLDNNATTRNAIMEVLAKHRLALEMLTQKRNRLRMFLDGPGGSGKSQVLKEVMNYASKFCKNIGIPFTKYTILVTASSGVAATLINGSTVHSSLKLNNALNSDLRENQERIMKSTRLIIIDEISMIDQKTLKQIDSNLRDFGALEEYYGGFNVIFVGDFRQLDPVGRGLKIYQDLLCPEWYDAINGYIELTGMYRFADDPEWGNVLKRFRDGCPLEEDFQIINKRVISPYTNATIDGDKLPQNVQYATPKNKERDTINAAVFSKVVEHSPNNAIVIFSSDVEVKDKKAKKYLKMMNPSRFWSECSESDCTFNGKSTRFDPVLKLYSMCPVMMVENENVDGGKANGTRGYIENITLKKNTVIKKVTINGQQIRAVFASDVAQVKIKLENPIGRLTHVYTQPKKQTGITTSFTHYLDPLSGIKTNVKYTFAAYQLPLVVNHATTGHKLQGCTLKQILVDCFSYTTNWPYVVLSRVKTIKGLFLRQPLKSNRDYSIPTKLLEMRRRFQKEKLIPSTLNELLLSFIQDPRQ